MAKFLKALMIPGWQYLLVARRSNKHPENPSVVFIDPDLSAVVMVQPEVAIAIPKTPEILTASKY